MIDEAGRNRNETSGSRILNRVMLKIEEVTLHLNSTIGLSPLRTDRRAFDRRETTTLISYFRSCSFKCN
jgi:hypothetical protein